MKVTELFHSIQGEGANSGKPAFFVRLAGCDVRCPWCDSPESWNGGTEMSEAEIAGEAVKYNPRNILITGGEPLMQDLSGLTKELKKRGFNVWLETSGTHPLSGEFDWVCLSPKRHCEPSDEAYRRADELKVVISNREDFEFAEKAAKKVRENCRIMLQPEWSMAQDVIPLIIEYVKRDQMWEISLQTHKYLNIK